MPVTKHASRSGEAIPILILSLIVTGIPAIITTIVNFTHPENWGNLYTFYALATFFVTLYFAIFVGMIAPKSKKLYRLFDILSMLMVLVFFIIHWATVGETGGKNLHIAVMVLITYCIYKFADTDEDKGMVVFRNIVPFLTVAIGLLNCLLFPFLGWDTFGFVLSNILMVIALIWTIVSIISFEKNHRIENIDDDDYTYQEETEEERQARILANIRAEENSQAGWVVTPKPDTPAWRLGDRWRLDDVILERLADGIRNYGHDYVEECNSMAEYWISRATSADDISRIKRWLKKSQKGLDKDIEMMSRYLQEVATYVFSSESLGKYIIFDFMNCKTIVKPYSHKDAFKFTISTFTTTVQTMELFSDKRSVRFDYKLYGSAIPLKNVY